MSQTNGHDNEDKSSGNGHGSEHGDAHAIAGDIIPETSIQDWGLKLVAVAALLGLLAVGVPWSLSGSSLKAEEHAAPAAR